MLKKIDFLTKVKDPVHTKIEELEIKISELEEKLIEEAIKNDELEQRLRKAKEMLPSWLSIQI